MQRGFKLVEYHKEFRINDLKLRIIPAGHILGSGLIEVSGEGKKLLYTGDLKSEEDKAS